MNARPDTNAVLNKLLILHNRSLPEYLAFAPPWHLRNNGPFLDVLTNVVTLQKAMVDRIGSLLLANGVAPDYGEFPMSFTALHDLSPEFLLKKMVERQETEILYIEKCVSLLSMAPYAQAVAQEALGEAKGHLAALKEVTASEPAFVQ